MLGLSPIPTPSNCFEKSGATAAFVRSIHDK